MIHNHTHLTRRNSLADDRRAGSRGRAHALAELHPSLLLLLLINACLFVLHSLLQRDWSCGSN